MGLYDYCTQTQAAQTHTGLHVTVILQALWHTSQPWKDKEQSGYQFGRGGYKITTVVIRYYRNLCLIITARIMWDESPEEHTLITSTAASTPYFKFPNTENVEFILI